MRPVGDFLGEQGYAQQFLAGNGSLIGSLVAGDDPQKGGFARTVAPEETDAFARLDLEADGIEEGCAVGLRDI